MRTRAYQMPQMGALALASGEFVGFLDHDDQLLAHALYEVVQLLNWNANTDFIYSDEIMISERKAHIRPFPARFLPGLSALSLLYRSFCCHKEEHPEGDRRIQDRFCCIPGLRSVLRAVSQTRNISHIPKSCIGGGSTRRAVAISSRRG